VRQPSTFAAQGRSHNSLRRLELMASNHLRRGQLHFAAVDMHRHLHGAGAGHALAGFGIADQVIDLQAVLPLHQAGAHVQRWPNTAPRT
jgi:hypothetical protein